MVRTSPEGKMKAQKKIRTKIVFFVSSARDTKKSQTTEGSKGALEGTREGQNDACLINAPGKKDTIPSDADISSLGIVCTVCNAGEANELFVIISDWALGRLSNAVVLWMWPRFRKRKTFFVSFVHLATPTSAVKKKPWFCYVFHMLLKKGYVAIGFFFILRGRVSKLISPARKISDILAKKYTRNRPLEASCLIKYFPKRRAAGFRSYFPREIPGRLSNWRSTGTWWSEKGRGTRSSRSRTRGRSGNN